MERAALRLGVKVTTAHLSPTLWGVAWGTDEIIVNSDLPSPERRFALAHELAHIGQARGFVSENHRNEEWLADWFSRELLLPIGQLDECHRLRDAHYDRADLLESCREMAGT